MNIYKIFRSEEFLDFLARGKSKGAPIDLTDGFIHFSTADQLLETAEKHFGGVDGLQVLAIGEHSVAADLRWEPSRGGALFPHLYRDLRLADVKWVRPMGRSGGRHVLPEGVV